jgi:hypothetical protein
MQQTLANIFQTLSQHEVSFLITRNENNLLSFFELL